MYNWTSLLIIGLLAGVSAYPVNLPCSRIVKIGQAIMVGFFKGDSTSASIRLDQVDCGGVLKTNVDYRPILSGIPSNIFEKGVYENSCMNPPTAPNLMYLIDVTDSSYNPFPGANFTEGVHVWNGAGSLSPPTPCPSRSSGLIDIPDPPYARPTPSVLRFAQPGAVTIRLAWSHGPQFGVHVVENCTYTVSASIPSTTPIMS